jgi:glycosyltransferase involved in cell wall biosynthesis
MDTDEKSISIEKKLFIKFPLISVVTVAYNDAELLEDTILSVVGQSYDNIEYVVLDGNSTDNTVNIIEQYEKYIDFFISQPDHGIYDAMNNALKIVTGDFLIFMNVGDTFFSKDTIKTFVEKTPNKNSIFYGDAIYKNDLTGEKTWRGGIFNKYRLSRTNICHQTIFYPKKVYKSNSYNLRYEFLADWDYNIKLFKKYSYVYLDQSIVYYDAFGKSFLNRDYPFKKDHKKLILKYLGFDTILYLIYKKIKRF